MKKPKTLLTLTVLIFGFLIIAGFPYPSHAGSEATIGSDCTFEMRDVRIYKTHLAGKYVFTDDPEQYFEIGEKYVALSESLAKELWLADADSKKAEIYDFGCLTWVGLNGKIGFYSSESVRPDTFILQGLVSPTERRVYKKAADENEIPLEEVLSFNPEALTGSINSSEAIKVFPNMGSEVYLMELERIIGGELNVSRDEIGAPRASFSYHGYLFWYYPDRSYDLLPAMTVFSREIE